MGLLSNVWGGIKRGFRSVVNFAKPIISSFLGGSSSPDFSSMVGPLVGAASSWFQGNRSNESVAQQQAENTAAQREFAQQGIRWKVDDAKAAGLHPLYALGGAGAAFAPNPVVLGGEQSFADMGQNLSRAASAMVSTPERMAQRAALDAARASAAKDVAIAGFYDSERARNLQSMQAQNSVESFASGPYGAIVSKVRQPGGEFGLNRGDNVRLEGVPEVPAVEGPPGSMWREYVIGNGLRIQLPAASNAAEALESVAENNLVLGAVVARNQAIYGKSWLSRATSSMPSIFKGLFQ